MADAASFHTLPFTILVDTREQIPYEFSGYKVARVRTVAGERRREEIPLFIPIERGTLQTGDYSIVGHESRVTVERKSLEDALSTFTDGRERFERELGRMEDMESPAVILEFEWNQLLRLPPERKVSSKSVDGSILAWSQRFQKVRFFHRPGRQHSQTFVLNWLIRWWNDRADEAGWESMKLTVV